MYNILLNSWQCSHSHVQAEEIIGANTAAHIGARLPRCTIFSFYGKDYE